MIAALLTIALHTLIAPTHAQDEGTRYAFIIGIDQYQDNAVPQLTGAVADAHAIRECLVKYCHFDPNNIVMLTSDGDKWHTPTWQNISGQSARFCSTQFKPNDLVFFYYAGHAVEVGGSPFLVPNDAKMTNQSVMGDYSMMPGGSNRDFKLMPVQMNLMEVDLPFRMSQLPVKNVIAVFDMCRESAWDSVDPTGSNVRSVFTTSMQNGLDITRSVSMSSAAGGGSPGPSADAVFFACQPGHASHEENGRGDFTLALQKALEGEADTGHSGQITIAALKTYLEKEVPLISHNQQQPYGKMEGTGIESLPLAFSTGASTPDKSERTAVSAGSAEADSHARGTGSSTSTETTSSDTASNDETALFRPNVYEFLPGRQWCDIISGEGGFTIRAPIGLDPSTPPQRKIIDIPAPGKNAGQTKMVSYICQGTDHYKYFRFAASFAQDPNANDSSDQILKWGEDLMRQKDVNGDTAIFQNIASKIFTVTINGNPITNLFGRKKPQDDVQPKDVNYGIIKGKRYVIKKADGAFYIVQLLALKNRLYMFQEMYDGGDGTTPFPQGYFVESLNFYPKLEDTSDQILPMFQTDELH